MIKRIARMKKIGEEADRLGDCEEVSIIIAGIGLRLTKLVI